MDSPAEYVNQLEAELRKERALRERAERERDEYQAQLQNAGELRTHMTSAASLAAGSATIAINRLQEANEIVEATVDWYLNGARRVPDRASPEECRLRDKVAAHIKRKESQS